MKCKYRVRWFYSKGALLVLFWFLLITFVIISMFRILPPPITLSASSYWVPDVLLLLSVLTVPLTGWLADAKFGNYKVVRFGVLLLFLATVFNCFYYLIEPLNFVVNVLVLKWFVFVCLFVCLSVCVDCYSCSMINELSFYRHLVTFSWILTRGFAK